MLKIELDNISPDGDGFVAYVKIKDDAGKVVHQKCLPYTTEAKFNTAAKALLADFKVKHDEKENIKSKVLKKLEAINKGETP